jgi:hypothetical protein
VSERISLALRFVLPLPLACFLSHACLTSFPSQSLAGCVMAALENAGGGRGAEEEDDGGESAAESARYREQSGGDTRTEAVWSQAGVCTEGTEMRGDMTGNLTVRVEGECLCGFRR